MNECAFSKDRQYRYFLKHRWDNLFPEKVMVWIGLNPSTADEKALDPTLNRIKGFCIREGANCFYMVNLFAFRATKPEDMKSTEDPVGPLNDSWLSKIVKKSNYPLVAAWGNDGNFKNRDKIVHELLTKAGFKLQCLEITQKNQPQHPLYVAKNKVFKEFNYE